MRVYRPHRDARGTHGSRAWAGHPWVGVGIMRGHDARGRVENWRGTAWIGASKGSVLYFVLFGLVVGGYGRRPKARLLCLLAGFGREPKVFLAAAHEIY